MATQTTIITPKAWHLDQIGRAPAETIDGALLMQAATKVGTIEGDEPAVRVPYVAEDGTAGFVAEGDEIPGGPGTLSEVVITTGKIATLAAFSREQLGQEDAAQIVLDSMRRSVVRKADQAFLSNATSPVGLLALAGTVDGGTVGTNLDAVADAITTIEAAGGTASHIIAAPDAWGSLAKLKSGTGSATNLLGAGTEAAERRLLSVPVLTSAAMPSGKVVVVDSTSVLAVYGSLEVARSDEVLFASDSSMVRVTFRCGWGIMRPDRVVKLSTTA